MRSAAIALRGRYSLRVRHCGVSDIAGGHRHAARRAALDDFSGRRGGRRGETPAERINTCLHLAASNMTLAALFTASRRCSAFTTRRVRAPVYIA